MIVSCMLHGLPVSPASAAGAVPKRARLANAYARIGLHAESLEEESRKGLHRESRVLLTNGRTQARNSSTQLRWYVAAKRQRPYFQSTFALKCVIASLIVKDRVADFDPITWLAYFLKRSLGCVSSLTRRYNPHTPPRFTREGAATKIQSYFRGHRVRLQVRALLCAGSHPGPSPARGSPKGRSSRGRGQYTPAKCVDRTCW